jgi:hypothetical protein
LSHTNSEITSLRIRRVWRYQSCKIKFVLKFGIREDNVFYEQSHRFVIWYGLYFIRSFGQKRFYFSIHNCVQLQYSKNSEITSLRIRRVWRYQSCNQNPYIEEEETTQWPTENKQKDKQRSTKHTHKTKDRVTRTLLEIGGDLRCSGRVSSSTPLVDFLLAIVLSVLLRFAYSDYPFGIFKLF